jgi:hypothetical protein
MTDRRGRAARWNTALVLVPGTAAVFGASVAWAADSTPHSGTTSAAQPPAAVTPTGHPTVDARVTAQRQQLQQRIATHRKRSKQLAHRLAALRAQAAQVTSRGTASGGGYYGSTGGYSTGYSGSSGSGTGSQPVAPPPVQQPIQAPPPPPPPPVNANTGASGTP